jgi:hypothetical protein
VFKEIVSQDWVGLQTVNCINTKLKVFRIRFLFYFKIVFKWNILKMAFVWVNFSPGVLQEQDFPESNLITADLVGKKNGFPRS